MVLQYLLPLPVHFNKKCQHQSYSIKIICKLHGHLIFIAAAKQPLTFLYKYGNNFQAINCNRNRYFGVIYFEITYIDKVNKMKVTIISKFGPSRMHVKLKGIRARSSISNNRVDAFKYSIHRIPPRTIIHNLVYTVTCSNPPAFRHSVISGSPLQLCK